MPVSITTPTVGSPRGAEEVDVTNALTALADAVNKGTGPSLVASLPLSPVDGQEVYFLADATFGVIWHLKYRAASASAYKWEFVGGGDLRAEDNTSRTYQPGTGFNAVSGSPVAVTVPLGGDYVGEFHAYMENPTAGNYAGRTAIRVGAAAAVDADGIVTLLFANSYQSIGRRVPLEGVAASTVLSLEHTNGVAATNLIVNRRNLFVRPVRVG